MKILALDIGAKRIGIAHGDSALGIAFAQEVLDVSNFPKAAQLHMHLKEMIDRQQIDTVLIGHPGNGEQNGGEQVQRCRDFADDLEDFFVREKLKVRVEFADESFSTIFAGKQLRAQGFTENEQRGKKDALAAAAFLQAYLEKKI